MNEIGYQFKRFARSYFDHVWFNEEYMWVVMNAHIKQIQNWGWNFPKDQFKWND